MAATLPQPAFGLQPPTNDDTMEISSDFGAMDGDIDIDLDSAGEQMRYEDDDQMIDDVKSDRGSYHDDDVMVDGDTASNQGDREMQDDAPAPASVPQQEHDEELLDFSEDEDLYADDVPFDQPDVQITEPPAEKSAEQPAPLAEKPVEQVQSETVAELLTEGVNVVDNTAQEQDQQEEAQLQTTTVPEEQNPSPSLKHGEDVQDSRELQTSDAAVRPSEHDTTHSQDTVGDVSEKDAAQSELAQSEEEPVAVRVDDTTQQQVEPPADDHAQEQPVEASDSNTAAPEVAENDFDQAAAQSIALTVDTEVAGSGETDHTASPHAQQPSSPTVTGMHPTIVEYQGEEIYLFPSRKPTGNETFLLQNENLANTSLGDLLQACRSVLDHTLSDDDELVLGVAELDLYISEDSTPAFSTRFSELLDSYVQLHRNDGNHNPDPFVVTLRTQTRFTNRLNLITQAIAEGKGFSGLSFLEHVGFPTEEDFDDAEYFSEEDHHSPEQQIFQDTEQQNDVQADQLAGETEDQQQHEEHHEEDHGDNDNTESHVSHEAEGEQDQYAESAEPAEFAEGHTQSENAQEDTQYYESHEEVNGQVQHNEPSADNAAQDVATEEHGEDDTIDFDEDDDSSLTTIASAEGNLDDAQPEDPLTINRDDLDTDVAQAVQQLDEIPAPPEDEHFDEVDFEDETQQNEDAPTEEAQQETAPAVDEYSFEEGEQTASVHESSNDAGLVEASNASSTTLEAGQDELSNDDEHHHAQSNNDEQKNTEQGTTDQGEDLNVHGAADPDEGLAIKDQENQHEDDASADLVALDEGDKPEYDPDYIDFDDDEDFDNEPTPVKESAESESAKDSPSTKRSYSERNEAEEIGDDGQMLKKVRSS